MGNDRPGPLGKVLGRRVGVRGYLVRNRIFRWIIIRDIGRVAPPLWKAGAEPRHRKISYVPRKLASHPRRQRRVRESWRCDERADSAPSRKRRGGAKSA